MSTIVEEQAPILSSRSECEPALFFPKELEACLELLEIFLCCCKTRCLLKDAEGLCPCLRVVLFGTAEARIYVLTHHDLLDGSKLSPARDICVGACSSLQ